MRKIGLRIDVDTFRGTKKGVPALLAILARYSITASFFFSVGPDNMGRHLWRLRKPAFLLKMLRTRATSLYGWDILLRGTILPGAIIGEKLSEVIRDTSDAGHEIGLHAWDHHAWQQRIEQMSGAEIDSELRRGFDMLTRITGKEPSCAAAPGWRCTDEVLKRKEEFPFVYNTDSRGQSVFLPRVNGSVLRQPQIPATLPTFDEAVGRDGVSAETFNDFLLSQLRPEELNVLTIHAEVEGIVHQELFSEFIERAETQGYTFVPLGTLLKEFPVSDEAGIVQAEIPGREGLVAWQGEGAASSQAKREVCLAAHSRR